MKMAWKWSNSKVHGMYVLALVYDGSANAAYRFMC